MSISRNAQEVASDICKIIVKNDVENENLDLHVYGITAPSRLIFPKILTVFEFRSVGF